MPSLSIIIPVRNEAALLVPLLARLQALTAQGQTLVQKLDLVVVDGGSTDGTPEALANAGFRVIRAASGRAQALNAGANATTGDILVFLHADTSLPEGWDVGVRQALNGSAHVWGRFDVRISGQSRILAVIARMMNLRSRLTGIATGDQAMFMTRQAYARVGGFPDQPLMEDIELSRRLKTLTPPACLTLRVVTSGRRWDARGPFNTILLMWRLRFLYWLGVSPERLALLYR